jgi:hypothetical protein
MRKKIKLTEADVRRLVEKVIQEQCGGDKSTTLGFADLGGMGMGFENPIESRYEDDLINIELGEQTDIDDEEVDDEEVDDEEVDDEEVDDEEGDEETKPGITGGSGKFSDKDVTDVKLFQDGKRQFNQLTVNQKALAKLLGYTKQ